MKKDGKYVTDYGEILKRLVKARKESGLKQQNVASKLGKYQSYMSKIETGERRVDIFELIELARIYEKEIDWFITSNSK